MKKRIIALLLTTLMFTMSACGNSKTTINETETKVSETESTVAETLESQVETAKESETESSEEPVDDAQLINIGEQVTIDDICDFSIESINITNDVMPPQPGNWYSHYEADAGKVYVDACFAYKNMTTGDVMADEVISGNLLYDGKYDYTGFPVIEKDSRSDLTYANITSIAPLSTEYLHYLFEVPEEVQSSSSPIELKMVIGYKDYRVVVRDGAANGTNR